MFLFITKKTNWRCKEMKISSTKYKRKPRDKEIGILSRELEQNKKVSLSSNQLAGKIEEGYTFVLGDFEGDRKVSNFISAKFLALDFDNGATREETLELCRELGLNPSIHYDSFSANPEQGKHNHRIILELDRELDIREFKLLQLGLMKLFPACDKACKDGVRLWLAGSNVEVEEEINEVEHILYLIKKYFYELDNTTGKRTAETKAFAQLVGIEVINGQLALGTELSDIKWSITLEQARGLTKSTRAGVSYKKSALVNKKIKRDMKQIDIDEMALHFPLLKDWLEGKYWAEYNELMFLATNLAFIKGGMKRFNQVIDDNPQFYDNSAHNQDYYKIQADNYINQYEEPKPMNFTGEFEQYSAYGKNLLTAFNSKQKRFIRLIEDSKEEITMEQAEKETRQLIDYALSSQAKTTIIKIPTGVGKSFAMINHIDYEALKKKAVLAFPNHKLREEIFERFNEDTELYPATTIQKPLHLLPEADKKQVDALYTAGDSEGAGKLFTKLIKRNKLTKDIEYQEYLFSLKSTKQALVSLTTHELALSSHLYEMGADLLIIDEDCLPTLFHSSEIKLSDIELLLETVKHFPNNTYLVEWLEKLIKSIKQDKVIQATAIIGRTGDSFTGKVHELEAISFTVATILNKISKLMVDGVIKFSSPVLNLFNGNSFWNLNTNYNKGQIAVSDGIKLVQKPQLPNVDKIIILSATASKSVWQMVDEDIEFLELSAPVKNKGTVIQYLDRNTSKGKLTPEVQEEIVLEMRQQGFNIFISYKHDKFFGEATGVDKQATFGATAGLDHMKGKDLAVVGTPNLTEADYNLQAFALSGNLPSRMAQRNVEHNGFRFPLYTFEKGFYQDYQLYCIESEILQSVGRARVKRTDANVVVLSHFPVEADEHWYEGQQL